MTTPAAPASPPASLAPASLAPLPPVPDPSGADALAGLRDIHLPPDVPFWPPAPGWFALAGLVVLVLLVLAVREWLWRQTVAYQAMRAFEAAIAVRGADAQAIAAAAAGVMRRLVRAQYGEDRATPTEAQWIALLMDGRRGFSATQARFLARAPYLPPGAVPPDATGASDIAPAALTAAVRRWIRGRA